jgi:hypothetical protein
MSTDPAKSNGSDQEPIISTTPEQPPKPGNKDQQGFDQVSVALEERLEELMQAESACGAASNERATALAFGIPLFSVSLAIIAGKAQAVFELLNLPNVFSFRVQVLLLWLLAGLVVVPFYYFIFGKKLARALDRLNRTEESYIALRLSTLDGRKEYFREQLFKLSSKASRVFFGDEKRFSEASRFAAEAGNGLDEARSTAALSIVQSYLNSLSELVSREEREQKEERYWQYAAIAIMVVYVGALVFAARIDFVSPTPQYLFGVPQSVILWGAAGSLAAILYRFYTEQGQIRFATEFRWLIARPIIGIIMGGVVYIALNSGLVLLTSSNTVQSGAAASPPININSFWIVAFLAGFSDKFYLGVIDLLVARTVKSEEVNKNTVVTQIERIPESAKLPEASSAPEEIACKDGNTDPATAAVTN